MSNKIKGRKSKLTPGLRRQICTMLAGAHTIRTTCAALGIGERSFFTWCEDPTFFAETQRARARGRVRIVESILGSEDWRAQAWYLERTDPAEFARVAERALPVDLAQPVAPPMECHIIVRHMTAEERALGEQLTRPAPPPPKKQNALGSNGIIEFTRT